MLYLIVKGGVSMRRKKLPKRKDKRIFRKTAVKSKKINVNPGEYRGGIRM